VLFYIRSGCGTCRGIEYDDVVTGGRWRRCRGWRSGRSRRRIGGSWFRRRWSGHDWYRWNGRDYRFGGYGNQCGGGE